MERTIFHCDLNCFYASVELLDHPELRHLPVAVCGDPRSRHGIILAKNEPAKAYGVQTAETIWQARKKCPELVLLPAHHDRYQAFSRAVNEIYQSYSDLVEPFGIDESWIDVTGTLHLFGGDPEALANQIRARIREELGLTISVGVSFNKIFAKLGSDYKKPDATTVISKENFRDMVWPLPVSALLYVGGASDTAFHKFGIETIGDLARFDCSALHTILGKNGTLLHDYANGLDHSPVLPYHFHEAPKSVGNGRTFTRNLQGREGLSAAMIQLSDQVAARLRRHGMQCLGVSVTIRDPNFRDRSHQKQLDTPTSLSRDISKAAMSLACDFWDMAHPVRAITITALHLVSERDAGAQLDLFAQNEEAKHRRLEALETAMDSIRMKYGSSSITAASSPILRRIPEPDTPDPDNHTD